MADGTPIIVKKKKVFAGGHHGGSWKVAYADFVTAMMAFFMVMWIMGMDPSTRSMIQGYFNDPFGVLKSPPKSKTAFALPGSPRPKDLTGKANAGMRAEDNGREKKQLEQLEKKVGEKAKSAGKQNASVKALLSHLNTSVTEEGLRLEFTETAGSVFFQSGDWRIRPEAEALLAAVAPVLASSRRPIIVEGHTDARPFGMPGYTNWDLSAERALEMRRVLARYGVGGGQFAQVRGYADTKLRFPENPYHYANRRVTVLLPFRTVRESASPNLPAEVSATFSQPVGVKPELH